MGTHIRERVEIVEPKHKSSQFQHNFPNPSPRFRINEIVQPEEEITQKGGGHESGNKSAAEKGIRTLGRVEKSRKGVMIPTFSQSCFVWRKGTWKE